MLYKATMIINSHQPIHVGYFASKELAAEAIMGHARENSDGLQLYFRASKKDQGQTIRIDYGSKFCYYLITFIE